jgi:hypothetical protein
LRGYEARFSGGDTPGAVRSALVGRYASVSVP